MTAITLPNNTIVAAFTDAENGWSAAMNRNLRVLDALVNLSVDDRSVVEPPLTAPANGTVYIVAVGALGMFTGHDNKLAIWTLGADAPTGTWIVLTPREGLRAFVADEGLMYRYKGGAWLPDAVSQTDTIACGDETTLITTGLACTFHVPFAAHLTSIFAGLSVAQSTGVLLMVDVLKNGVSIFAVKLTFDNFETATLTAATAAQIATTTFARGDVITVTVDQLGTPAAKGLKLYPTWALL